MGYLNPISVAIAFFVGSLARDWATFWFARKKGEQWVNKKPKLQANAKKVSGWLEKSPEKVLLSYRFIYGFKIVILLVAGVSGMSWPRFAFLTAVSTFLWIVAFGVLGFYCGEEVTQQFSRISDYKWHIIIGVGVLVMLYWIFFRWRKFKRECGSVGIEV